MYKLINTGSFNMDDAPVRLMDIHSKGVDKAWTEKRAAVLTKEISEIRPEEGKTFIHLVALGDGENFGPNRNGDYFSKKANIDKHHTFVKNGHVYKNHKNKNPEEASGHVKASAHNDKMSRVELVVGLDNDKWDKELQKLATGEDLFFSMGCVLDPTYPVLTKNGYKDIQELTTSDEVLTHKGRWRKVKALNRRVFTGKAYKFHINGLPLPLEITEDHPMWAKVFEGSRDVLAIRNEADRYFNNPEEFEAAVNKWAHAEHVGVGDRFFYQPIKDKIPGYGAIDSVELATLMGYYLAEGSLGYNKDKACLVDYSCCMSDSLVRRVPEILKNIYPDVTCSITPRVNSKPSLSVKVFSTEFAEFMRNYVGRGCKNKIISPEIFNAAENIKTAYFGAWVDGDGFCDSKGVHISTANRGLALQGRDLLASMGIPSSIYRIDHSNCPTSGNKGDGIEYTLNISWLSAHKLTAGSTKIKESSFLTEKRNKRVSTMRECPDGRYAYRIKEVKIREVTDCQTWNIEVEEDESYTLAGMISHNCKIAFDTCSICGNNATNPSQYCDHMTKHAGQILDNGKQVYVDNPDPTFFDISGVFRPADRIAFGLQKIASQGCKVITGAELAKEAGYEDVLPMIPSVKGFTKLSLIRKLSELEKEIEASTGVPGSIISLGKCFDPDVFTPSIDDEEMSALSEAAQEQPGRVFSALAKYRISLPLETFLQLVMGPSSLSGVSLERVEESIPGIFSRFNSSDSGGSLLDGAYDPDPLGAMGLPEEIHRIIRKMVPGMSLMGEPTAKRINVVIARKKPDPPLHRNVIIRNIKTSAYGGPEEMLAREYAKYKLSFLTKVAESGEEKGISFRLGMLQNYIKGE